MGGFFGVVAKSGLRRATCSTAPTTIRTWAPSAAAWRCGTATGFTRFIHDITNAQFRSKFEDDLGKLHGTHGHRRHQRLRGPAADHRLPPGHLRHRHRRRGQERRRAGRARPSASAASHFSEMSGGEINPTELVATLINQEATFEDGIRNAQEAIEGSCSILLLTDDGHLRRPRPARPHARHHRPRRTAPAPSRWRPAPSRTWATRSTATSGRARSCCITAGRRRDRSAAGRPDADLLLPVGLLRLSRLELRGHQRRGRPQPLRRGPGPQRQRRGRPGGRHPRLRHRPRHRLRQRGRRPLSGGRSSSTRPPGRAASCRRTRTSATWSPG